uniref:Putative secreted protein n=1 Tax=Ixodes ricinus TaxID=34613 RepID=A0A147BJ00_IXORI
MPPRRARCRQIDRWPPSFSALCTLSAADSLSRAIAAALRRQAARHVEHVTSNSDDVYASLRVIREQIFVV